MPLESKWALAAAELPSKPSSDTPKNVQKRIDALDEPSEPDSKRLADHTKLNNGNKHQPQKEIGSRKREDSFSETRDVNLDTQNLGLGSSKWAGIASQEEPKPYSNDNNSEKSQTKVNDKKQANKKKSERSHPKDKDTQYHKPSKPSAPTLDIADSIRAFQIGNQEKRQPITSKSNRRGSQSRRARQTQTSFADVSQPDSTGNKEQTNAEQGPPSKAFTKWEDLYDFNNETSWADDDDYDYSR